MRDNDQRSNLHGVAGDRSAASSRRSNGTKQYAFSLWGLPPGVPFDRVNLKQWPTDYVQTAGSRDRMTVELRGTDAIQGIALHGVLANPNSDPSRSQRMETIEWDEFQVVVMAHEVFDADAAYDVFLGYLQTRS